MSIFGKFGESKIKFKIFRLDLRNNDISLGGLMALSLAARENQSVTRIDLDKPPKDNTLPVELIVSFRTNKFYLYSFFFRIL